jgi:membrane protein DedA with SNARE-associated domain/rhodanese-related sulfurtransferase
MQGLIEILLQHGVLIVFAVTLAARIGAPLPASTLLVIAGGLTTSGSFAGSAVFAASLLANLLGDTVWFWGGRRYGQRVLRLLCRISISPDACVRQSESLILRWGGVSLIAAKFVPGVSVVAAPMAGALAMRWRRFVAFDLLAALLWTGVFMGLGRLFSRQIGQVLDALARAGALALVLLMALAAGALAWRFWRRLRTRRALHMPRITVDTLAEMLQAGDGTPAAPLIIDVRSADSAGIDDRRLPGALRMDLHEIRTQAASLPRDREIVLYCNCPNEASAAQAAQWLLAHGFQRARPLAGGLDAWMAATRNMSGQPPPLFESRTLAP